MDIAITGSSGLIGTPLVARLEAAGHNVVRVVRSAGSGPGTIMWKPTGNQIDAAGLEGIDAVINLAGAGIADKRWSDARRKEILDSRVRGTTLLSETMAGLQKPPAVLLNGSAIGVYGDQGATELDESSDTSSPMFIADVCRQWEAAAQPAIDAGVRTAFLRTGVVLSKQGGALAKMLPLFKFGLGGKMGSGKDYWSWISIDDEVGAIVHLLTSSLSGPVNLTAPNPATNAEFTKALGKVMGRPTLLPVPSFGPKLLLGSELAESLLFTSARILPKALLADGFTFLHPDLPSAFAAVLAKNHQAA